MKVAFVVGGFYTEGSGIARSVASLANHLVQSGHHVALFVPSYRGKGVATGLLRGDVEVVTAPGYWFFRLGLSPGLKRILHARISEFDVVHTHSLWMLATHYATLAARGSGVPIVASIQGFLDPWALAKSRLRKLLVSTAFQKWDLACANTVHAVTEYEVAHISGYVTPKTVAIIPNGVDDSVLKVMSRDRERDHTDEVMRGNSLTRKKIVLFLSRLHFKKGLDLLLQAWQRIVSHFADWMLVIAGPDDGYAEFVSQYIESHRLHETVRVLPPCYGDRKLMILGAADVFVLPSRSEGLPMALLEALGAGKPVVYTTGCYFPEAAQAGAGIEVPPDVDAVGQALTRIMSLDADERKTMGARGHELVRSKYTWRHVASQFEQLYAWLANGQPDPPPEFVRKFDSER